MGLSWSGRDQVMDCCVPSQKNSPSPVPVVRLGVNDVFGKSGPAVELLKLFGLTAENVAAKAKEALAMKK